MNTLAAPFAIEIHNSWNLACRDLGATNHSMADLGFLVLEGLYATPPRFYHHLGHVHDCLNELARSVNECAVRTSALIAAAIIAHDCVYFAYSNTNEEASAAVAAMLLREAGVPDVAIATVRRLILATKHQGEPADEAEAVIRDIDLASLAAAPSEFDANSAAIRAEYINASIDEWRDGRVKFFRAMLARPSIYFTSEFKDRYELFARRNLERAIRVLESVT